MKSSKRKHILLILLISLIALYSTKYIMSRANAEKRNTVAVVLPKGWEKAYSGLMDGIRDYVRNNDILLDVWYKECVSSEELQALIETEAESPGIGVLLVYPEMYMKENADEKYQYDNVLAITDTMKDFFSYTATFEQIDEEIYSFPLSVEVMERLEEDKNSFIYVQNTYKLGYCSMEKIQQFYKSGNMDSLCLACTKVDRTVITNMELDALLAE